LSWQRVRSIPRSVAVIVARTRAGFARLTTGEPVAVRRSRLAPPPFQVLEGDEPLGLRAGNLSEAARLLDELRPGLPGLGTLRATLQSVLAAVSGAPTDARRWAAEALEAGSGEVVIMDWLEVERSVGVAALFERDAAGAVEYLNAIWEHTLREHVDDPGAFPVAGDLVEALVQAGDLDSAKRCDRAARPCSSGTGTPLGTRDRQALPGCRGAGRSLATSSRKSRFSASPPLRVALT
jgi:hypothetical protein